MMNLPTSKPATAAALAAAFLFALWPVGPAHAEEPVLRQADHVWHMADGAGLKPHGEVKWGTPLEGAERTASLARGGDAKAVRIGPGGYLALATDGALKIDPKHCTVAVRLQDANGVWLHPILGSYGSDKLVSLALRGRDATAMPMTDHNLWGSPLATIESWLVHPDGPRTVHGHSGMIEALWGAREPDGPRLRTVERNHPEEARPNPLFNDVSNAAMRINFPVGLIGPRDWHDLVLRFTGPKLQLFIDGVLVDEEYPIGQTRERTLPFLIAAAQEDGQLKTGFDGLIDHVAVWNRTLSDEEVTALSGGAAAVRERELAILGPEAPHLQYFRARGHNRKAGDLIPYWDEEQQTLRMFYLILRRNMHSKWDGGHGGLEIWQASTKDLKSWTHHPVTIPITEQWEAWNGTGAVAYLDGKYHWFYPAPHYEGEHNGIQHAVSKDGVHFEKQEPHPFLEGGDCEVFQTDDGLFHLIKAGPVRQASTQPLKDKVLVAWVKLRDLEQQGGSVLTIEAPDATQFDALVFGEIVKHRWMAGSNRHLRSSPAPSQQKWPEETAKPDELVQMALVYHGNQGTLYRNGTVYGTYPIPEPLAFPSGSSLLIGWRHTGGGPPERAYFRGSVLDARLYDRSLTVEELAQLKPDAAGGPEPAAWYDFENGSLRDRAGKFPDAKLFGKARIEGGALVLEGQGDYLKALGSAQTQVRLTSTDLQNWTPVEGSFIESDKRLATCPNIFRFGDWHYYLCGSGVWRSKQPFGPWEEHSPLRLDNLAVPKTAAFGSDGKRRIYAGFLGDGGWGGNSVLRELVHDQNGRLGTRFVPELIPAAGEPLPITIEPKPPKTEGRTVRVDAGQTGSITIPNIPGDYRLRMEIEAGTEALASSFGIGLGAATASGEDGCDLVFEPGPQRVRFSKMSDSSGRVTGGPCIEAVEGMNRPFPVDIIVRHDILDAEIGGFRSLTTRFWNPRADRIRLFVQAGTVTFRDIRVQPLTGHYEPYPGWRKARREADPLALNFHLMHPGGDSRPGDPNAAFFLDGTYHLHYILAHPWKGKNSFSFVHVTSPDMLHWTWQQTKLQPSFTGHGMFSGTGFLTKDGMPAAVYHGQASGRNQIALAKDRRLSAWEKPYPVEVRNPDGSEAGIARHWDPDCFLIGDTYYAISGGQEQPLFKSQDLKNWTYVGPFLSHQPDGVVLGEDISCPNFFPLGEKWMLLCISHSHGCRYYLGDWDAEKEQFVPESHGRMNWPRVGQGPHRRKPPEFVLPQADFFAPESVLTHDGRRVMWAWLATMDERIDQKTVQSLPRELSLAGDGSLRIRPLRELESLRFDSRVFENIAVPIDREGWGVHHTKRITDLRGDACELRLTVDREEAQRKRFGLHLFTGPEREGLPVVIDPARGTLQAGTTEAAFAVSGLPEGEDVEIRIFIDKYLVEVFANDRQAMVAADLDWRSGCGIDAYSYGTSTTFKKLEIWRLKPTNQGYFEARRNRIWEPETGEDIP